MMRHGEGNGTPLQYSCLENPMDGGAWSAAVHGVTKSRTGLSDLTFTFHFHALEKAIATHSSVLAWRIPGTGHPGGLPSMGLHRAGHDWRDLVVAAYPTKSRGLRNPAPHTKKNWQPNFQHSSRFAFSFMNLTQEENTSWTSIRVFFKNGSLRPPSSL